MTLKPKIIFIVTGLIIVALIAIGSTFWWFRPAAKMMFRQVDFAHLPGWEEGKLKKSLETFQMSCRVFLKQNPESDVGTKHIDLQAKDWYPACRAALNIDPIDEVSTKAFFQTWFVPIEFFNGKPVDGLFTGYYMASLKARHKKSKTYNVPIYETPNDLLTINLGLFIPRLKKISIVGRVAGTKVLPYYTREEINHGAIKKTARVLAWIKSPVDRLFLEIQGSGVIEFEDKKQIYLGYDAQNGARYTAIAGVLIKKGIMTKHNASMQAIKHYLEAHPNMMDKILNQNKSFVFFRKLSMSGALGSQGIALTPGYSLAIDLKWVPIGAPLWLSTTRPKSTNPEVSKPMHRLMIAQDTGGAIKGKVRGDVYWGGGEKATMIAGHMKNEGHYWLLLPRHTMPRIEHATLIN